MEEDIRIYKPKMSIIILFHIKKMFSARNCFVCVKETSQGDVLYTHKKVFYRVIDRPYCLNPLYSKFRKFGVFEALL